MIDYEQLVLQYSEDYVDLAASTVAFVEKLEKQIDADAIMNKIPREKRPFFLERLNYYRDIYRPQTAGKRCNSLRD